MSHGLRLVKRRRRGAWQRVVGEFVAIRKGVRWWWRSRPCRPCLNCKKWTARWHMHGCTGGADCEYYELCPDCIEERKAIEFGY